MEKSAVYFLPDSSKNFGAGVFEGAGFGWVGFEFSFGVSFAACGAACPPCPGNVEAECRSHAAPKRPTTNKRKMFNFITICKA